MKFSFPHRPRSPRGISAFTLIELLVVIAIIAILVGLVLQVAGYAQEKAANARAASEIEGISSALDSYKLDNGTYPDGDGSENSTEKLLDAIDPTGSTDKVYYEIPANMLDSWKSGENLETVRGKAKQIVDPFGNPYRYYYDSGKASDPTQTAVENPVTGTQNNGPQFFDLWSYGKKGADANKDKQAKWIKNW